MTHGFPTLQEVLAIHDAQIAEFDGALASALVRPQLGYYEGLVEEAAALLGSPVMNHPFVDGNKRTAFRTTDVFGA